MSEPEDDATMAEGEPTPPVTDSYGPDRLATLGELLESSHARFVARVRERQRKGEIE